MISTRKWCVLLLAIFLAALLACLWPRTQQTGGTAIVRVNGETVLTIDLNALGVQEFTVGGNVIRAENGRVCVVEADCPDQVCVRQGWIGGGDVPIACLPNRLTITVEGDGEPELDAVSQ